MLAQMEEDSIAFGLEEEAMKELWDLAEQPPVPEIAVLQEPASADDNPFTVLAEEEEEEVVIQEWEDPEEEVDIQELEDPAANTAVLEKEGSCVLAEEEEDKEVGIQELEDPEVEAGIQELEDPAIADTEVLEKEGSQELNDRAVLEASDSAKYDGTTQTEEDEDEDCALASSTEMKMLEERKGMNAVAANGPSEEGAIGFAASWTGRTNDAVVKEQPRTPANQVEDKSKDEFIDLTSTMQLDEREADINPYSALSPTLDHDILTAQPEETEEEMEGRAISAQPDMKMKEEQEEQLADCKATNADWTVIQSRRQQREERQQDGKGSHAPSCQQSRAKKKSRRPRRQQRLNKLDAYIRTTLTPEE